MTTEQKLSYYINKAAEIEKLSFEKKIRVGLLGSFTLNGLAETLTVKCAEKNIQCITYVGGYNQYTQEILNQESGLYKFKPDISFLLIDVRTLFGDLFHHPYSITGEERKKIADKKAEEILDLARRFCDNTKSKLVLSNFNIPTFSPYGIFETKVDYGFHEMISELNDRLAKSLIGSDLIYLYNFAGFVSKYGEQNIFDYKQFFFGDMKISLDYIPHLANELMSYIIGYMGISKKCIVVDLDNTLWGGIVGEDGFNGIKLGPEPPGNAFMELQKTLLSLYHRGIILAINSKNNYEDAIKVIKEHPYMVLKEEHFGSIRISWNDKVANMKEIANELNIGLDSMVFLDDDPVNREFMRISLPQVLTVDLPQDPSQYAGIIKNMNEFSVLTITSEDQQRGKMYAEQRKRVELEQSAPDLENFLKQLDLKISVKNSNDFTIPRISQLTLKTNQFNLTTKRYQESDIKKFTEDPNYLVGCVQVEDKFGDNGITGVFIVHKENQKEWFIDTFLLSCRVMGREVEKGIMGHILNIARKNGVERLKARFIPSQKNKPIEGFLPSCGFQKEGDYWTYSIKTPFIIPDCITVRAE
jgi:FkbH-like protein